ncbi:hypothetical protein [Dolichospermum flos-aquae]|uniref:Uncharacterized protein n=1 Tax=Dolichospermum flos-aquae CCAP 1403/13F TaxID=315271 RepID=A0A6H2C0R7_DOLFA|nr:hypothetical protein [Dolichospermum flos-aquae]QJB44806.1 hypothetical protein HGD76_12150 [Dolichospermum flos-aquae CCAP 1403/13F]
MFFDLFDPGQNRSSQVFSVRPAQSIPDDVRTDEIQIKELEIYEEFLTQEPILIDRSKSSSTSVETFEFSKQWSRQFNLEYEKANKKGHGSDLASSLESSIGVEAGVKSEIKSGITSTLKNSVEETIKTKYSITEGVTYKRTETTQISIPAYTKTKLIICWKNIWQKGVIEIVSPSSKIQIPFSVLVSLTFDRKQIDL